MCGIAGMIGLDGRDADQGLIQRACDILSHRGPDGEGFFVAGPVGLGHRRLSIIDLTTDGRQPMANEDGSIWLTFNGEIYNYLELIPELKAKGHIFKSKTDTEVIVHAYEEWGFDCLAKFNGMWAFALWDRRKQRLWLARDRFGVKPLYYALVDNQVFFASETKAILGMTACPADVSPGVLYRFLTTAVADGGNDTFFQGIQSLPAAHYLEICGGRMGEPRRYWDVDPAAATTSYDYDCAEGTFLSLLDDAVKLRLRSDVPVGTCLSGGLDSSSIVALMSRRIDQPVKTFSAVYADPGCDESSFIDEVNRQFNTEAFPVYPQGEMDLFDVLPQLVWFQDMPTAGPGVFSQWHVMSAAHGQVKVLLDGQGGDELLGGYWHYFNPYLATLFFEWMRTGRREHLQLFTVSWREISALTGQPRSKELGEAFLKQLWQRGLESPAAGPAVRRLNFLNKAARFRYGALHPEFVDHALRDSIERPGRRRLDNPLDTALYRDLTSAGIPALLRYEDRNSMAFSIEARTPFLDYRLVEFCFGLPFTAKINGAVTKQIMRRAMAAILPKRVVDRSDKKGYPTPLAAWLRHDRCRQAKEILLAPESRKRHIFAIDKINIALDEHAEGRADLSSEIWRWLMTEMWFERFIDVGLTADGSVSRPVAASS